MSKLPNDQVIMDPRVVGSLNNPIQGENYIIEKIKEVEAAIKTRPPASYNALNSREYLKWERRTLILYGQAMGALQGLNAFSIIDAQLFRKLKDRLLSVFIRTMGNAQMGL